MISNTVDTNRSIWILLLTLILFGSGIALTGAASASDASLDEMQGNGTEANPYVITTVEELQAMNQNLSAHYVLGNDINASATEDWNGDRGFEPIGNEETKFKGSLDGRGHAISHLSIDRPGSSVGLFQAVKNGNIGNLKLLDVELRGSEYVGGVAGESEKCTISHVFVSGSAEGTNIVGGLVGNANQGTELRKSGAEMTVDGTEHVGGLLGFADATVVSDSYFVGSVTGKDWGTGGIIGYGDTTTLSNVYAHGIVEAKEEAGGLVGIFDRDIQNAYANVTVRVNRVGRGIGPLIGSQTQHTSFNHIYWSPELAKPDSNDYAGDMTSGAGTKLTPERMVGPEARDAMDGFDFGEEWVVTDRYPILGWQIENVSVSLADDRIVAGSSTTVDVTLELFSGRTATVETTATIDANTSIVSIAGSTVESSGSGTAEITASFGEHTGSATLELVAPPDVDFRSGTVARELLVRESSVSVDATFHNSGGLAGDHVATLTADGETVATKTVTVDPDAPKTAAFRWTPEQTGTYDLAVDGSTVGTVEVVEPPEIETADANLTTPAILAGSPAAVSATLENPDRLTGEHAVSLSAGEAVRAERTVSVGADSTKRVRLQWTPTDTGTYNLTVDGADVGNLTVVGRGVLAVENVSAPSKTVVGESATVSATVESDADVAVTVPVTHRRNGTVVASKNVTVGPNGMSVSFESTFESTGTVTHAVVAGDDQASAETNVGQPAIFEITNLAGASSARTGEEVTVTASVENAGGTDASKSVTFRLDGATVATKSASLAPGEAARVSASFTLRAGGEHTYGVATESDNTTATITAGSGTPSDDSEGTSSSSGFGPGFGLVAALVAITAFAILGRRR